MPAKRREPTTPTFIEQARRAQIIEAAIETILEAGFARASLAAIAKRAGISKSAISYHFSGKDDLVEQIVTDIYTRGAFATVPAMAAETTASGMLAAYIRSNVAFVGEHQREMRVLLEIFPNFRGPDGELRYGTRDNDITIHGVATMLRAGQDSGEFRDFAPEVMAMAIRAAIDVIPPRHVDNPGMDIAHIADEFVRLFAAATRAPEPVEVPRIDVRARMEALGQELMAAQQERERERKERLRQ